MPLDVFRKKINDYLEDLDSLSANNYNNKIMKHVDCEAYNFDKIVKNILFHKPHYNGFCPKSADALIINGKKVIFIEFKSGFKPKLRRSCQNDRKRVVGETAGLKNQILHDSIKLKLLESYIVFEKEIIPRYVNQCDIEDFELHFYAVICDCVPLTVASLPSKNSDCENLSKSLERYKKIKNNQVKVNKGKSSKSHIVESKMADGKMAKSYYYDTIRVVGPAGFVNLLGKPPFTNS